jgi:hypothetical protein
MAHYAKLDENNIVIETIVIADKDCLDENGVECEENGRKMCEALTGHAKWKKTSYNTRGGVYYTPNSLEPSEDQSKAYRLNFAQSKMKYDEDLDGFVVTENYSVKLVPRMIVNPQTGNWVLPNPGVPCPEDLELETYPLEIYQEPWFWHEHKYAWVKLKINDQKLRHIFTNEELL